MTRCPRCDMVKPPSSARDSALSKATSRMKCNERSKKKTLVRARLRWIRDCIPHRQRWRQSQPQNDIERIEAHSPPAAMPAGGCLRICKDSIVGRPLLPLLAAQRK